ncbi:MAG: SurA N-terminal domain-containing protein [Bacteroidota bacterium]
MALIGRIRKQSGFLVIIIGVALAAFVLGDFIKKRPKTANFIAEVAGEKINPTDFNKKVEENISIRKQNAGKENLTPTENYEVRQQTWNQVMNEIVMNKQYEELGITVTVDELNDLIRGKNPHQYIQQSFKDPKTGVFDPKLVNNFLQNLDKVDPAMKERYLMIEKAIKSDRLTTKYNSLLTKGFYVPTAFAKLDYEARGRNAKVRLTGLRYQTISDSTIKPTDADYQKYYDENSYKYKQDRASRDLEYVVFDVKASTEDRNKIEEDVKKLYVEFQTVTDVPTFINSVSDTRYDSTWRKKGSLSRNIDSLMFSATPGTIFPPYEENGTIHIAKLLDVQARPDSLRASHILVSYAGTGVNEKIKRTKDAAKKTADSLLAIVKKDPKLFEILATTKSDDQSSAEKSGDVNWFADGAMVPSFNQAVLQGKIGDIVEVESRFGFHIIKITGKKEPVKKVRVALLDRVVEASGKTFQDIFAQANAFAAENTTIEKFDKTATDKGLNKRSAERLESMSNSIPGVTSPREIVRWAFNEATKKGDVSTVFDTEGSYVVAVVKEIREKGILPLDQIKDNIKPLVIRDKKAEILIKRFNDKLASAKSIDQLASGLQTKIDTANIIFANPNVINYGREPQIVGTVFSMKKGQLSAPLKGEMAVYVLIVDDITEPAPAKDYKNEKMQLSGSFQGMAPRQIPTILEEKANIKDNRILFY